MPSGLRERLVAATPLVVLGVGILAFFASVDDWWLVFVLGFGVVTPLVAVLLDPEEDDERSEASAADDEVRSREDALDVVRERYARGELDETQFERKLERLLATETLEDVRDVVDDDHDGRDRETADRERA